MAIIGIWRAITPPAADLATAVPAESDTCGVSEHAFCMHQRHWLNFEMFVKGEAWKWHVQN